MIAILLIAFYVSIISFLTYKSSNINIKNVSKVKLVLLLQLKIIAGFFYIFISKNYINGGDIFNYYSDSLIVLEELKQANIINYLHLTFGINNTLISDNISSAINQMGYWYDTPSYFMVRLNSIFNLLSFGKSIYINSVFFSFISFSACLVLANLFQQLFKYQKNWISYIIFLSPSLLFWTSGMHKESISVFLIAILLWTYFKLVNTKQYKYIPFFIAATLFLSIIRVFILVLFIPPLLSYFIWTYKQKIRPIFIFGFISALTLICTYVIPQILKTPNLVDAVIAKKHLYEALGNGNTVIDLGVYQQSYFGIVKKMPQALFNSLVRPHFLDIHSFFLFLASVESFIIAIFLVVSMFYIKNLSRKQRAIIIIFLFFSISYLILTGLIVPNLGAILRYRSVAFFILIPSIAYLLSKKDKLI